MNESVFKSIAIHMSKGGVGKTTMTANLAFEMAKFGKVALIDCDQQGNLTSYMYEDFADEKRNELLNILKHEKSVEESLINIRPESDQSHGIYLIGTRSGKALNTFFEGEFRDSPFGFKKIIQELKDAGFNYVFFDLPPSIPYYVKQILSKMNEIVLIVQPEDMAVDSMRSYAENLSEIQTNLDSEFEDVNRLIVNMVDSTNKVHNYFLNEMRETGFDIYEMKNSKAVVSACASRLFLQEYMPNNQICKTLTSLAESIRQEK